MKTVVLLFLICVVGVLEALKCEFHKTNPKKVRDALNQCMSNNDTEKIWKIMSGDETDDDSSSEEDQSGKKNSTTVKRAADKTSFGKKKSEKNSPTTEADNDTSAVQETSTEVVSEDCIIQCVLEKMELVDSSGMPDHSKVLDELLKIATARELRNFLQDSVDQCYQEVNRDKKSDKCTYSTKIVKCLVEKGKTDCADWPAGTIPF